MSDWKPSAASVVLFPALVISSSPLSALELYRKVWGTDPGSFRGPANPLMPSVAQGNYEGLTVSCTVQQSRVDFSLNPHSAVPIQDSFPLIEDKNRVDTELVNIAEKVGRSIVADRPIVRVALNLQFLNIKTDIPAANREVLSVIPPQYRTKITNEEDFILQINRPFTSRAVAVRMNSIVKWSVERIGLVTFAIPAGMGGSTLPNVPSGPETREFIAAAIGFDSSNAPVQPQQGLSAPQQSALLRESLAAIAEAQAEIKLFSEVPTC